MATDPTPDSAPTPGTAAGSQPPGPSFAGRIRGGVAATAPTAFMAVIVVLIFILLLGTLAEVGLISLAFMAGAWTGAWLPFWTAPLWNSLILTVVSYVIGFAGAMVLGLVRAYGTGKTRNRIARIFYGPVSGYVHAIRGTPFFVQLWLVYYAVIFSLPQLNLGGRTVYFWAAMIALTLNTLGYQAEVFRGGFQSVGQGQIEAGKAMGLKGRQIFSHITLPQSLRLTVLPLTNEFISLFKASTITSYISVYEMFVWAENMGTRYGHPIEGFVMISAYYLAINIPLSRGVTYMEKKFRIPGLGTPVGSDSFTLRFLTGRRKPRSPASPQGRPTDSR